MRRVNSCLLEAYETNKVPNRNGIIGKFRNVITPLEGFLLYSIVKENNLTRTLEIGLGCGATAAFICAAHKHNQTGSHQSIDSSQATEYGNTGTHLLSRCSLLQFCRPVIEEPSYFALSRLALDVSSKKLSKFHLIVIDGHHTFERALIDFFYADMLLEDNGLIVFHDIMHKAIDKVVRYIYHNYSAQYKLKPQTPCFNSKETSKMWQAIFSKVPGQGGIPRSANTFTDF